MKLKRWFVKRRPYNQQGAQPNHARTARDPSTPRDPASLVIGAIAAQVAGGLVTQMSPFTIAGLMDGLSLSERDAGFVVSLELLILAVTAIAITPVLSRFSDRRVALLAVALALSAQGASIFSASLPWLTLLRGLAGIGEGVLYAVSLTVVASRANNPDKVYGYFQVAWALGSVALFGIGGQLTAAFAQRGIFALMTGVTLALAPLLLLIPDARAKGGKDVATVAARISPALGVMTLAATVLYLSVSSAIYAFSAPLGERAGLDTRAVSYALTVATLVGLAGAGAATAINVRWGRMIPISGFFAGFALVVLVLCLSHNPSAFIIALVASVVIYYFSVPYLFGLAAALDHSGRWAAAAGSAYLLGFAAGPLLAGVVITGTGYAGLAVACVAITAAAWGLTMVVSRRLGGTARTALPAEPPA
ncbi:MFS transporter [Paraburkholderia fungorum]|uniref:MFS transporter n=1 Tax=Paraburkholderia fungorum TaxID=134537 RepID=UPI0038B7A42B